MKTNKLLLLGLLSFLVLEQKSVVVAISASEEVSSLAGQVAAFSTNSTMIMAILSQNGYKKGDISQRSWKSVVLPALQTALTKSGRKKKWKALGCSWE